MHLFRSLIQKVTMPASILLLAACSIQEKQEVNVIPKPASMTVKDGFYRTSSPDFTRGIPDHPLPAEGYRLTVGKEGVVVKASDEAGFFYATQTLRQLMTPEGIPYVDIQDAPRFEYRGLMLDVSRHFFPKEFVLKLLNEMAYYKLNRLHLHLTDGGGWRLQIDKYPELTRLASYRTDAAWGGGFGRNNRFVPEGTEGAYGGYYTKDDIREILAYAADRQITVIPEIEMPAHSSEVFAVYPELCCAGEPYKGGDFCIGNEKTFLFLQDVLTEVIELFPSEYIHAKGRKLLGWDEILEGGLAPEATVMSWQSEAGGIQAARMGHDVVMEPSSYLYFDYYQADPTTQPLTIGGYVTPRRVYSFNPVPVDSLTSEQHKHILGVQANLWTEFVNDEAHAEYMYFPRTLALAEVAWTPQDQRDWQAFKPRINVHIDGLHARGINAFSLSDEIDITMKVDTIHKEIRVMLESSL